MKLIATTEEEIAEVIKNLSKEEKINRVKSLYPNADEILEVLGYYDESMDDDEIEQIDNRTSDEIIFEMASNNGNFETAIAFNSYLPL